MQWKAKRKTKIEKPVERRNILLQYYQNVLLHTTALPVDVSRPFMDDIYRSLGDQNEATHCPKCSTPRLSGFCRSRLLKRPQKSPLIKTLLKKDRQIRGKMKQTEKLKLSLYRTGRNTLEVTCLICKYKVKKYCSLPEGKKKPVIVKPTEVPVDSKVDLIKKKKKNRKKDVTAGLLISVNSSKSLKKIRKNKRDPTSLPGGSTTIQSSEEATNQLPPEGETEVTNQVDDGSRPSSFSEEKNVSKRLADSIAVSGKSKNTGFQFVPKTNSKKSMKERDLMTKTLKSKMKQDKVAKSQTKNALANFLSSLY